MFASEAHMYHVGIYHGLRARLARTILGELNKTHFGKDVKLSGPSHLMSFEPEMFYVEHTDPKEAVDILRQVHIFTQDFLLPQIQTRECFAIKHAKGTQWVYLVDYLFDKKVLADV